MKCVSWGLFKGGDKGKRWGRDGGNGNTTHRNKEHMCTQALCAQSMGEGGHIEVSVPFTHLLLSPFVNSKQRSVSLQTSPSPPLLVPLALDDPISSREAHCLTMTGFPHASQAEPETCC